MAQIMVGQKAPDFSLYDSDKQLVTLSEQVASNVLLLFFPFAFSSVCTTELCSMRDNLKAYESLNTKTFGISVDSLYSLKKFKETEHLNFSLLSDFNKEVSTLYGCLHESFSYSMKGVSKRSAFLIDSHGIVQYAEVLENPANQPNFEAIQVKLRELTK
ncbi:MAG TPA: redoxin domain-containing protein [Flavisolibacter sp.]|jgi:peroxiredoxin|nr:redoxin domain-containing protein [Flavisolibacter sp.]